MDSSALHRTRLGAVVATLAIAIWTIAGGMDRRDDGFAGPLFEPDYSILHVPEGSPLDEAGFQPGDRVVSVEGIPIESLGMYSRWPRSLSRRPGESLTMVVDRDGETVSGRIVYGEPSADAANLRLGGLLILLSFIGFGLWVLFTVPTMHAVRLAFIGLALGAAAPGPYLGSWDGVATHIQVAALVLWTLLLLRFFLLFPKSKRIGENRLATVTIWAAWGALIICLIVELIFHPRFYHTFGPYYALLMTAYLVLALVAVTHTLVTTPKNELRDSGMMMIVVGVAIAVVFITIAFIDAAFLWETEIPGSSFFPLLIAIIPLTLALAVRKQARSSTMPAGSGAPDLG
jgi:hypothetical protein